VPSLFRRKSIDLVDDQVDEVTEPEPLTPNQRRAYTPKKGEATRKRPAANRRLSEAAPADRKEAAARSREKTRQARAEQREGMMNGDDRYLTARDKGPVRRLVRDVVDARRNVGSIFFFVTVAVLVCSMIPSWPIQLGANVAFLAMIFAILVDSVLLSRRIRQVVSKRFPKMEERWGSLYFYAVMRSVNFRRMRIPKAQVNVGDKV
jgi:hypothetical protein